MNGGNNECSVGQMWTLWMGDAKKRFCLGKWYDYRRKILDIEPKSQEFGILLNGALRRVAHAQENADVDSQKKGPLRNAGSIPRQKEKSIQPSATT